MTHATPVRRYPSPFVCEGWLLLEVRLRQILIYFRHAHRLRLADGVELREREPQRVGRSLDGKLERLRCVLYRVMAHSTQVQNATSSGTSVLSESAGK